MNNMKTALSNIRSSMSNHKMIWIVCSLFAVVLISFICFYFVFLPLPGADGYSIFISLIVALCVLGVLSVWLLLSGCFNMKTVLSNIRSSMSNNKMIWIVSSLFAVVLVFFICSLFTYNTVPIFISCIATLCVLGVLLLCLVCSRLSISAADKEEDFIAHVPGMPRRFSAQELESATHNFGERLGGGGFGSVFKGTIDDGTGIAVKRLDPVSGQGRKEFLAEVKTIGSIHHFNLVKLVGYCAESSHKFLVYEFMSNGSLDKWIFNQSQELALDWSTRRKIILQIAKGLAYLHEECSPRIIHFDIKPQNVLLDSSYDAKLSDFGLARFIDRDQSQVETIARGTPGYMAPELHTIANRGISEKIDVYSFGIVVLEILCGRKNTDLFQLEEEYVSLLQMVRRKAKADQLSDVVDTRIGDVLQNKEAAIRMIRLALWCSNDDSRRRASMSTVVKVLEDGLEIGDMVDYSFMTVNMELHETMNESGSAPLLPVVLSGPR